MANAEITKNEKLDALDNFTPLQWGVLVLPAVSIGNSGSPRLEQNDYLDATASEFRKIGFGSRSFNCTLAFFESNGFFPDAYKRFVELYMKGEAFDLKHPIHGTVKCFARGLTDTIDSNTRNGLMVTVEFVETLSDLKTQLIELAPSKASSFSDAEIDAAYDAVDLEDKPDLFDTLNDINNIGNQLAGMKDQLNRQTSMLQNRLKHSVNKAIDTFKDLKDVNSYIAIAALREHLEVILSISSGDSENTVNYLMYSVDEAMSLDELVSLTGNSAEKLEQLNPSIVGKFVIDAGTNIVYEGS